MIPLVLSPALLADTIEQLRTGGQLRRERVALWLAAASGSSNHVREVYEPEQTTERDYFHLPPSSVQTLMAWLRAGRLRVAAQIHTHPEEAFHSHADDRWAIVRHVGALSLVLPWFAAGTSPATFLDEVKIYELAETGQWTLTPNRGPQARLVVRP